VPAQRLLDQVQSLAAIDALAPDAYVAELGSELGPELEPRDAALVAALASIDAFATRVMRIQLEHALAADSSIGAPTRRVFAQTVASYTDDLSLLSQRARDVAARGGAGDPAHVAELVVASARATLARRADLRAGVLGLVRELATASIAEADAAARDRTRPEAERRRWSAVRRDLEALAADPAHIATAPMAARLQTLPDQLDEPAPEATPTLADLIELD
jgi:hypothetical protein